MTSKRRNRKSLLVCSAFCAALLAATAAAQQLAAPQLIDSANAASDLSKVAPYELSADLVINPGSPGQTTGHLLIYRDKDRWRAEMLLGEYRETRVRLGNQLYIDRSTTSPAFGFLQIINLEDNWKIRPWRGAKLTKVSSKTLDGASVNCFHAKIPDNDNEYCVLSTGLLARRRSKEWDEVRMPEYHSFEGVQFPASVTLREKELARTILVQNIEVRKLHIAESTFAAPAGARPLGGCEDRQGGKALTQIEPKFPDRVKKSGYTYVLGILEKDGQLSNVHVFSPSDPAFEETVRNVISHWRFSPASCGGEPVAIELEIFFAMRRF